MTNSQLPISNNRSPLIRLRLLMAESFSLEDIHTLCFDLNVNFDELPHLGLTPKIRSLIQLMIKNGRLSDLVTAVSRARRHINWPTLADLEADTWPAAEMVHPITQQVIVSAQGEGATAVGPRGVNLTGDNYGTIITGDTYNYYIEGTHFYMPDFTTAVKNFLYNYLGDEANPVPFGGRNDALAQIEQWRTNADAPPRLLITAPAGRGKSALLVRWSAYLQAQQDVAVVFMPISIRFNTNQETDTFSLLATRLAHLYGKEIPAKWGNFPASTWRRLVAEYLQEPLPKGRRLLLIMDGLDEAAWQPGGDIFPHQLPDHVRLVISARYRGGEEPGPAPWLRLLDWDNHPQMAATLELETLTQTGVKDVLERMGCPLDELSQNVDIATELYRLSNGDPLLVELYIKDLWQRGDAATQLRPEDLREIQSGYEGYFEKWWADQEKLWGQDDPLAKDLVNDLLDVLSMALGPLTTNDLRQLLPGKIRSRELKRAIKPLNRFVIGDGQEQGYTFAHPKLGQYFCDQLEPDEQAEWQSSFLTWGERNLAELKDKLIQPRDVSRYLMLYYGRHMEQSNVDIMVLLQLLKWEWIQVWYEKTGLYSGFLQDVNRVWKRLRELNVKAIEQAQEAPYIGQEVFCALCHASINSLANNIPDKLLVLLLQQKIWTDEQILAYVRQRKDIKKRSRALALLSPYLLADKQSSIWKEIFAEAQGIQEEDTLVEVLTNIAPHLPENVFAESQKLENQYKRVNVLKALAPLIPQKVSKASENITNAELRANILTNIAPHMPGKNQSNVWLEALTEARKIEKEKNRVNVLIVIAPHLPQEVYTDVWNISYEGRRAQVLTALAPHLPVENQRAAFEAALKEIGKIKWGLENAQLLVPIIPNFPAEMQSELWEKALNAALRIHDPYKKVKFLTSIVPHLPAQEQDYLWERALTVARRINYTESQVEMLISIASFLPIEKRKAVLEEALATAEEISFGHNRAKVMISAAPYLSKERQVTIWEKSLAATEDNHYNRANVLSAIGPKLSKERFTAFLITALKMTQKIRDEDGQVKVLIAANSYLLADDRSIILSEALATAKQVNTDWRKKKSLKTVAPYMPEETIAAAREFNDAKDCASVLVSVIPYLPKNQREAIGKEVFVSATKHNRAQILALTVPYISEGKRLDAWREIISASEELRDQKERAHVLVSVAPHLPKTILIVAKAMADVEAQAILMAEVVQYLPNETLTAVWDMEKYKWKRAQLLSAIAPNLPAEMQPIVWEEAYIATQDMGDKPNRLKVLSNIIPHLAPEVRSEILIKILEEAREIDSAQSRAMALSAIAPYFSQEKRPAILAEALTYIRKISDERWREKPILILATFWPEEALAVAREINDEEIRARILANLGDKLSTFSHLKLYKLWQESLSIFCQRTRQNLLSDIDPLMLIIHKLGGEVAVRDTWKAVQTVSTWWP